jgi:hypothetical protein
MWTVRSTQLRTRFSVPTTQSPLQSTLPVVAGREKFGTRNLPGPDKNAIWCTGLVGTNDMMNGCHQGV